MSEDLTFTYDEGSVTLVLDEFFPASIWRLDKLLKMMDEVYAESRMGDHVDNACGIRSRMAAHCYDRARELEQKLPELQAAARTAKIEALARQKALKKTQVDISFGTERLPKLDLVKRRKAREQLKILKEVRNAQHKELTKANEYARAAEREWKNAAYAAEQLRKNRERILTWETRKETK